MDDALFGDDKTAAADAADRQRGKNDKQPTVSSDAVAQDQIRAFVERIERMEEEKKAIADDIREIYAEAKGNGFDIKVLRRVIRERGQDKAEREDFEAVLDLYRQALGMYVDTPLGRAALEDAEEDA